MHDRVATARRVQGITLGLASLVCAPVLGWWLLAAVAVAGAVLAGLEHAFRTSRRPELASLTSISLLQLILTTAVAETGGAHSPMLGWLAVPVVMLAARFRVRVVIGGVAVAMLGALLAQAAASQLPAAPRVAWPLALACWAALLVSLVAATITLLSAELSSRSVAAIDPLTGLGNRLALSTRFAAAAEQAAVLDAWISVIMVDLDRFKAVNDTHGHDLGDQVLKSAAYEMRRELRSIDAVYRLGGGEFLVLLPGVAPDVACHVAERLRNTIAVRPLAGIPVTLSAGFAAARGNACAPDLLMRDADQALYAAKHAGRNRVEALRPVTASQL